MYIDNFVSPCKIRIKTLRNFRSTRTPAVLTYINACADTGAQTCASSPEILRLSNLDQSYLIPTSHIIVGVTQSGMDILGVLFLRIEAAGRTTLG